MTEKLMDELFWLNKNTVKKVKAIEFGKDSI